MRARRERLGCPQGNRLFGKSRHSRQTHQMRTPLYRGLHRRDEGHLVGRAATPLLPRALAAQIRVIHLHAHIEFASVLAPIHYPHRLQQLVLDQPGRLVSSPCANSRLDAACRYTVYVYSLSDASS